jgi:hypothetical protein
MKIETCCLFQCVSVMAEDPEKNAAPKAELHLIEIQRLPPI